MAREVRILSICVGNLPAILKRVILRIIVVESGKAMQDGSSFSKEGVEGATLSFL